MGARASGAFPSHGALSLSRGAEQPSAGPAGADAHGSRRRFCAWIGLAALTVAGGGGLLWWRRREGLEGAAREFHRLGGRPGPGFHGAGVPASRKEYPNAKRVSLAPPGPCGDLTTGDTINRRRSHRAFGERPLTQQELSNLLHYAGGITAPEMGGEGLRAGPSAGALYPIEMYPVVRQVEGLEPGIYHYRFHDHALDLVIPGDLNARLGEACAGQHWLARAPIAVVLAAVLGRTEAKYGERGYRYVLLDCGHISENLYLAATAMGLGACAVGAFEDERVNALLGLDGEQESALLVLPVGSV
jgi:SagB-type dehydrogenase family enzyme